MHRLQRDSPKKEANKFSAFIRDQWVEGAGGLGKHMRMDGGMYAPWLRVRMVQLGVATNFFLCSRALLVHLCFRSAFGLCFSDSL